ncbi:FAD/NAD(P)-binding protein [Aliirhizobium cellulosilyticum]|uniref:Putative NAD(P)/FAD-binding protein YdhS n=1 Tax=Aliirhizobium cellulosilyticum TaxID=393664 RepID=A0A7W6TKC9_9HYPH|nr:FAD/NAD(P)-binding protein [Rhizobium cellulosilyticum]MBB4351765.1 putative NAD(P)/FAD-binding protein YdhS [Rhizobium cellulosilyticum]MBB4414929.1 putative NAD(P)/FAD-binding protein YdhS [Rhizobium cellulosilyticum]MBB4449692.1 putative NAD(P)/FAD-binding protein YdhS [Rhizobium cellulosilyticum]
MAINAKKIRRVRQERDRVDIVIGHAARVVLQEPRMRKRVAIVGSGPTALFALQTLITCSQSLNIVIFESAEVAGKGTPYQRGINAPTMLSNIPSIEIPSLPTTLVEWLSSQSNGYLTEAGIPREEISDRAFYPRVVIGDYFRAQFDELIVRGTAARHAIEVRENCTVSDVIPVGPAFDIEIEGGAPRESFDYVIVATGHSFAQHPETSPGYFDAPWPATALETISSGKIGILGTSLSAIDAVVTLAASFGRFNRKGDGNLVYTGQGTDNRLHITMMSRKGLLPEADFYFPIPYEQPKICTAAVVEERIILGSSGLLDDVFDLFKAELAMADPDYAERIKLDELTADTFAAAYYGVRDRREPFEWAATNLTEAKRNYASKHTVAWRYAILITHEIIESAVSYFTADDLARFNRSFKGVFADDYATVPHLSIERLLALHRAGYLEIVALGDRADVSAEGLDRGARVTCEFGAMVFDTFIDATGQKVLSADDLPFAALKDAGLISPALTVTPRGGRLRTGGISVDDQCRPLVAGVRPVRRLYTPAVSYLLHKRPFVQGITSAAELGETVASSIIADLARPLRSRKARRSRQKQDPAPAAAKEFT